ncbi:hypothetical protein [Haloferula sp. BvORR071]|uniref:hypothetical protein n=1 Tax=Haloferula sp. BvORR071 TaxID=1396141 RepID=UPI002240F71B|nr:hypothetical protein [Haloferula sp. BvORR071]
MYRQWSLGFILFRWRYLFWGLPLAGFLIGAAIEWRKHERALRARAILVPSRVFPPGYPSPPSPHYFFPNRIEDEIREHVKSDEVLEAVSRDTGLADIRKLRSMLEFNSVRGTITSELTVTGRRSAQTEAILNAALTRTQERMWRICEQAARDAQLGHSTTPMPRVPGLTRVFLGAPPPPPTAWERIKQSAPMIAGMTGTGMLGALAMAYGLECLLHGWRERYDGDEEAMPG